jgi:predicted 3-demethylubiquinone-9 3-methyltransferase (glyoxalase superfamily)
MSKLTPFLWFDNNAEDAMNFYTSIFHNSKVLGVHRADGKVLTVTFELDGQKVMALNGGPMFRFNESFSMFVDCEDQKEVDYFWEKLSAGGATIQCGWLKDKFGLCWQIIPKTLMELLSDPDPKKASAVMQAMLKMNKIVVADLQLAYQNAEAA